MKRKIIAEERRKQAIGTVIIIAVMLILVGLVLFWMYSVGLMRVPAWAQKLFGIGDGGDDELPWDLGELSEIIRDERHPDDAVLTLDLTYDNLLAAFLTEDQAPGIYIRSRVIYYDEGEAVPHRVVYRRSGDDFRVEIYKTDNLTQLETLKIKTGTDMYVRDTASGSFRSLPFDADAFSPEYEAGIPSVAEIIEAVWNFPMPYADATDTAEDSTPAETEEAVYSDCELSMITTSEGSVYYVKFTYADLGISEEYYVASDYGIVLSATTTIGGQPVYSYETISFSLEPDSWELASYYDVTD